MSAYRDALTRLFLKGAFAKGDVAETPRRVNPPASSKDTPARARHLPPTPGKQPSASMPSAPEAASQQTDAPVRDYAHPGKLLAGKLRAHGKTASDLARDMRVPVNRVTAIINGQRGVTADTALRLGHWFDETPESWLDAQQHYELARARTGSADEIRRLPRLVRPR